jgi:hypothetical protein
MGKGKAAKEDRVNLLSSCRVYEEPSIDAAHQWILAQVGEPESRRCPCTSRTTTFAGCIRVWGVTPAMEAGLTDHVLSVAELLGRHRIAALGQS